LHNANFCIIFVLAIFDIQMLGKTVKVIENQSSLEYNLDCTNFSKGLYHYQLRNEKGENIAVGKLVVD